MSYKKLQIWRSVKSIRSNIVEGYGRRGYKKDFLKFLIYSQSSNDETLDHLEILWETQSLKDKIIFEDIHTRLKKLGIKINNFIKYVQKNHRT